MLCQLIYKIYQIIKWIKWLKKINFIELVKYYINLNLKKYLNTLK